MRILVLAMAIAATGLMASAAGAVIAGDETVTYTYDAQGRLVKVERSGTANSGVKAEYTHDKANNRKNVKVTGSSNPMP